MQVCVLDRIRVYVFRDEILNNGLIAESRLGRRLELTRPHGGRVVPRLKRRPVISHDTCARGSLID